MKHNGNRTRILIAIAALAAAAAVVVYVQIRNQKPNPEYGVNLLVNSDFETVGEGGVPADWYADMWFGDEGVSILQSDADAYAGTGAAYVQNVDENDARFAQDVAVAPDSIYRFSCMVRAEGCGAEASGAGLSVKDTFASSETLRDTEGEWTRLTLYGQTGPKQTSLTVMLRVGGYGSLNVGGAWFDDAEFCRVQAAPDGVTVADFSSMHEATAEQSQATDFALVSIAAVACLFLLAAVTVLSRGKKRIDPAKGEKVVTIFTVCLAVALVLRVALAVCVRGHDTDMNCFEGWACRMAEVGPAGFYAEDYFCDYPPGYLLVLYLSGMLRAVFGFGSDSVMMWLLLKTVPILVDLLSAYLIFVLARKRLGDRPALFLGAFYAFNPAVILNSALWGQVDTVFTILLAVSILEAARGRWALSIPVYALAVLMKPQALLFGPLGLCAAVVEICACPRRDRGREIARVAFGVLGAIALIVAVTLPFSQNQTSEWAPNAPAFIQRLVWVAELYFKTLDSYAYATINACNIYVLAGLNWTLIEDASAFWRVFGTAMYFVSFASAFVFYAVSRLKTGKRDRLFLLCAYLMAMVFAFGLKMHERYLFPALLFLGLAYIKERDARVLVAAAILSVSCFLNGALVLRSTYLMDDEAGINAIVSCLNIGGALLLLWTSADLCLRGHKIELKEHEITQRAGPQETFLRRMPIREDARLHMRPIDYILIFSVTAIYAAVAFVNLGSTSAPETAFRSSVSGETVTFELEEVSDFHMTYYGGVCNSTFTVAFSEDGSTWYDEATARYDQGEVFHWLWYVPGTYEDGEFAALTRDYPTQHAKYVRITFQKAGMTLHEVGFLNADGEPLPVARVVSAEGDAERAMDPMLLLDEQATVPPYPSYYNGTYFDEIYHARTGYEFANGMTPYENTHPPLGKVFIMLGIKLFGMVPFGWRFFGTLAGVLMLPIMYLLVKQLVKRTDMAFVGMFLMAVDLMHFTQTRIATIDSYGVFFIMLMYLFMIRYCQMSFHFDKLWKTLVPLFLSGVCMGLGIASKWIDVYAGVGIAVLFFYSMWRRYIEYCGAKRSDYLVKSPYVAAYWKNVLITLGCCVLFFVVIPLVIYYFSYYWYCAPSGGLTVQKVIEQQVDMFKYHSGLYDDHYFASPWYEWPLIMRPMWYFSGTGYLADGLVSSISCMGNPAVWWGGLAAILFVIVQMARGKGDKSYLYVALGFLAQYLPWVLVNRTTFIYHYFASVPFIILAIVLAFDWMRRKEYKWYKWALGGYLFVSLGLFVAFYPLASGTIAPRSYVKYLRWFSWYNY